MEAGWPTAHGIPKFVPQVVVMLMLFSSFYINSANIPVALSWSECRPGDGCRAV